MFLGLSLTTWLILLGVFAIVTPIVGKQVAKDSLEVKNGLSSDGLVSPILFPADTLLGETKANPKTPIQTLTEKQYISRMMCGGVWTKFLSNLLFAIFTFALIVIGFIIYSVVAFFRGIFSTK